jgi:hypothetical protein
VEGRQISTIPDWLPSLIYLHEFGGDWDSFINAVYQVFRRDFITTKPSFRGIKVEIKKDPSEKGKEFTFWHIVQVGEDEASRIPDIRRCERVPWIRPIIDHEDDPMIKVWPQKRNGQTRIALWFEEKEYMVILACGKGYVLLLTTFMVTRPNQKRRRQREYEKNRMKSI